MKDGAIVQTATPEELVLHPATDYVAEFTRHIPRAKVLRLATLATPLAEGAEFAGDLPGALRVAEAADRIEAAGRRSACWARTARCWARSTPGR